jgi:hypothetical protein
VDEREHRNAGESRSGGRVADTDRAPVRVRSWPTILMELGSSLDDADQILR